MTRAYSVALEIAGPFAMFSRPDTGSTPVSYPVPPFSAAKGMFEAVARLARGRTAVAEIVPTHVEVCCDIRHQAYVTNYGGPLRKPSQVKANNNYQLSATLLVDVCFRIYGLVQATAASQNPARDCHQLQSIFERRLGSGQTFYTPCLGWKEFTPAYFGVLRASTKVNRQLNARLESLLESAFDETGKVAPMFRSECTIRNGVLRYGEECDAE